MKPLKSICSFSPNLHVLFICLFIYLFIYLFMAAHSEACGILVPRPGVEPRSPAVEAWSANHWTAREFPVYMFILHLLYARPCTKDEQDRHDFCLLGLYNLHLTSHNFIFGISSGWERIYKRRQFNTYFLASMILIMRC